MPKKGQSDYDAGFVYVATSRTLGNNHSKIGISRNPIQREDQLNQSDYGGVDDWHINKMIPVSSMRPVEKKLHDCFHGHEIEITQEIFDVPYPKAANYADRLGQAFKPAYPVPLKKR